MNDKKPVFRWITAIVILFVAGLFYAVYFTDLGKPPPPDSARTITAYDKTALPTTFAVETQVPTVELDWAYANQDRLKIAVKIRGLETNSYPGDWICDPYVAIDKPIPHQLSLCPKIS